MPFVVQADQLAHYLECCNATKLFDNDEYLTANQDFITICSKNGIFRQKVYMSNYLWRFGLRMGEKG